MTTTVKITTHSWPVRVSATPMTKGEEENQFLGQIAPNSEATFYPHSGQGILIEELPLPSEAG